MASVKTPRRVLIVSSHPLFGEGLRQLLRERRATQVEVVGLAASTEEALAALETQAPDLVILNYDDKVVNRKEFLARFIEGGRPMRVVLVSLKEGGEVVVYDRRTLAPTQAEDWLEASMAENPPPQK